MTKVRVVQNYDGDWQGLYVNGKLVYENHSISPEEVLEALISKTDIDLSYEWEEAETDITGRFPFDENNLAE